MKVTPLDFQKAALYQLRADISAARPFASTAKPWAIAFSAPIGSGKTIVMTALFEAKHTAIRQANAALLPATLERLFLCNQEIHP